VRKFATPGPQTSSSPPYNPNDPAPMISQGFGRELRADLALARRGATRSRNRRWPEAAFPAHADR